MYVCLCKGITESELLKLADAHTAKPALAPRQASSAMKDTMLERASAVLGVGTGCGCCLEFAGGVLEQRLGSAALA